MCPGKKKEEGEPELESPKWLEQQNVNWVTSHFQLCSERTAPLHDTSSPPPHACLPGGEGAHLPRVTQHLPWCASSLQGTQGPAAKGRSCRGGGGGQHAEGQKPVGVEQQVPKDASEPHPHQLSQQGWYGGEFKRDGEQERRGKERGRKEDREEERQAETGGRELRLPYTRPKVGKLQAPLADSFKKKTEAVPTAVFLPLGTAVWSLHTHCYSPCPRPAGRRLTLRALIHNALCIRQARSFCATAESSPNSPTPPTHTQPLPGQLPLPLLPQPP